MLTFLLALLSGGFFVLAIAVFFDCMDGDFSIAEVLTCCAVLLAISLGLAWLVDYRDNNKAPCVSVEEAQ
jgi:hypothetical protein